MTDVKCKGQRGKRWNVKDRECIGRECFAPGEYQHRGATMSGSRNTGDYTLCCMNRAYHGCPQPNPPFDAARSKKQREEGWAND